MNNNKPFVSQLIIISFVSVVILGMVAFAFSDTFKEITSPSKSGSSEKKEIKFERIKDDNILNSDKNLFSSTSDNLNPEDNISHNNSNFLSKIKKGLNKNEEKKILGAAYNSDIYEEFIRAYKAINRALEKEYKLYGNKTRINGQTISQDKLIEMIKNQMTVVEIDENNMLITTEGNYFPWAVGNTLGVNIRTQNNEDWRAAIYCHSASECEKMNPNVFSIKNDCGRDNDYRLCPADNTGYAYLYKKSAAFVFNMFPNNEPFY